MCGFAGQVNFGGVDRAAIEPRAAAAMARLRPRGPDAQNCWYDAHCAFVNTRLAVIDLSDAGTLPMARHGLVIAYNGEIYNFRQLRAELAAAGHRFESDGDTEVILAGWREWGEGLLPKLVGMFAFALWDPIGATLVLARDRFGKKPLLFHTAGGCTAFSSELRALEAMLGSSPPLDMESLRLLFMLRYVPEPWTIVEGVQKLPSGHLARITADGVALRQWHRPAADLSPSYRDKQEAAGELVRNFDQAVEDRLVADVPLGVFLSGGIDSALVAASAHRASAQVRTFTVGFEGAAKYYEERPAAAAVASHLGADHTEISVSPDDALRALDGVFLGLDEPFADSSAIPTYLLSRETRKHVTVALSGDGADEVFGGYRKYQGELMAARYQTLPRALREGLIEPLIAALPERKSNPILERARRLRRFTAHAGAGPVARQAGWVQLMPESEADELFVAATNAPTVESLIARYRCEAGAKDPINAMLYADMRLGLTGDMLVKVDRMSMANSLEVRCPFLDHRVVACAQAMPGAWKLVPGRGKKILRDAFGDRLPNEVFDLPKKGFEIPIAEWLVGSLDELTRRAIDPGRLARQNLFRPELPRLWYDDLKARRRDTSEKLWTLVSFQAWCERFRPELAA